ncbi:diacylglycerol kinase [Polynucleobacter sp. MWH-Spelu-300-X4]|uniref:diacylglycerol kinase n=1 Tax=Polynucleobacter sp. MWH-Spelu-300-X4 TaxID=2689109 RepID=UPI001BFED89C|nr:diacylglycerol kinase [Polynucleobacter sp. MWH-Spelu-300-X4]QWD79290.1 diacylglycerol kinase [Polynucleobacter sp. MWH-Spelu-300-X4]
MWFKNFLGLLQRRLIGAFKYSVEGLLAAWKSEEAIKVELTLLPVLIVLALYFGPGKIEKILLIGSAILVLIVELLNTGLEKTIDRISQERHELSKIVKDIGSAAVLAALLNLLMVWGIIFLG